MSLLAQKGPRLKLNTEAYGKLWKRILDRDGWRCQHCGDPKNLQVHHIQSRSSLGSDEEANLITLCANCHARLHGRIPGDNRVQICLSSRENRSRPAS
jgi:5-methylcytosine-specific restriction endonuclease McrA